MWDILSGKLGQQAKEPVAQYVERFMTRARIVPSESPASLCVHLVKGLLPELRAVCCLDRENREWNNLPNLIRHIYAEEVRWNLRKHPDSCFLPHDQQESRKRQRTDGSVPGAAAVVKPAAPAAGGAAARPARAPRPADLDPV